MCMYRYMKSRTSRYAATTTVHSSPSKGVHARYIHRYPLISICLYLFVSIYLSISISLFSWFQKSVTRRSSGVAPRACVRVYARVLVPPNLYIHIHIRTSRCATTTTVHSSPSKGVHARYIYRTIPMDRSISINLSISTYLSIYLDACIGYINSVPATATVHSRASNAERKRNIYIYQHMHIHNHLHRSIYLNLSVCSYQYLDLYLDILYGYSK